MQNIKHSIFLYTIFFLYCPFHLQAQEITQEWAIDSVSISKNKTEKQARQWFLLDAKKQTNIYHTSISKEPNRLQTTIQGLGLFSNGDYAPFWLTNNQYGIGSNKKNKTYLKTGAIFFKNIKQKNDSKLLLLTGGFDFLLSHNLTSDTYIQQAYLDLNYYNIRLSVGMKERHSILKNSDLSSGGLTLSENARPIPQIEFSIPTFVPVPYTKNKLLILGGIAYGLFSDGSYKQHHTADGNYASQVLYHRKYGFLNYKTNQIWSFIVGLEMDTQWGGHFYKKGEYWAKSSAKLKDFIKVLVPTSGGKDANITDRVNIVGNVYGSSHFILTFDKPAYQIKGYHEHFFEDHSGLIFKNIPDGLYGLELNLKQNSWLSSILFEYLHTKDQSGPFLWDQNENISIQVSGGDNYYNHVDYISLSNFGYVLGNPFFTSPIYNRGQSQTVYNTRLSSFHGGFAGNISDNLKYKLLLSYSKSWGTPLIPSSKIRTQFSSMLEGLYTPQKLKGWSLVGAIAYDHSNMIGNNTGFRFKVSKTFNTYF